MESLEVGKEYPMVLRKPFVQPILGKFGDTRSVTEVGFDDAVKPLHMYTQVEVIEEFEADEVVPVGCIDMLLELRVALLQ